MAEWKISETDLKLFIVGASFLGSILGALVGAGAKYAFDRILQRDKEQFSAAHKTKEDTALQFMTALSDFEQTLPESRVPPQEFDVAAMSATVRKLRLQVNRARIYFDPDLFESFNTVYLSVAYMEIILSDYIYSEESPFDEVEKLEQWDKFENSRFSLGDLEDDLYIKLSLELLPINRRQKRKWVRRSIEIWTEKRRRSEEISKMIKDRV